MATAVEERARPPPRMMAPGPCTADSADTVAAISAVVRTTCAREAPRLHCPRAWTHPVRVLRSESPRSSPPPLASAFSHLLLQMHTAMLTQQSGRQEQGKELIQGGSGGNCLFPLS